MDLCMIQPRVVSWHTDGRPSLVIGEEDGRVALVENLAPRGQEPNFAPPRYLEQVDPYLKSGALSRPVAVDWNGDGKLDLLSGNSAGYIQFFENTGSNAAPVFEDRGYLQAGGKVIRRMAGPNGSVQGPAETKWGYTNISVADWDLDGKLDILVNDIWGAVIWYRNIGTATKPELAAAQPIEVEWPGDAAQARLGVVAAEGQATRDAVAHHAGGRRLGSRRSARPGDAGLSADMSRSIAASAKNGALVLLPPERIFVEPGGRFLNLAAGRGGASGRRKINLVDWDGDGDLDLVTDGPDGPVWYENIGSQQKPVMQLRGALLKTKVHGHNPTPYVVDWNGDGKPDLIVGTQDGFFYYSDRTFIDAERTRY